MMRQFGFLIYLAKMIKFGKSESPSRLVVNILLLAYQNIKIWGVANFQSVLAPRMVNQQQTGFYLSFMIRSEIHYLCCTQLF